MDFHAILEQAAAGALVGLVLQLKDWGGTRCKTALRTASSALSDQMMERRLMGRSGHINPPDLAHGPHRELVELMHRLLSESGLSGRAAARTAGLAHGTFQKALSRPELPTYPTKSARRSTGSPTGIFRTILR